MARNPTPTTPDEEVPTPEDRYITAAAAYSTLATLRATEVSMRWEGAKTGMYFNIPGFIAVSTRLSTSPTKTDLFLVFVGAVLGALANQYLYMSIRRSGKHFQMWNKKLVQLEKACPLPGGVEIFTSTDYTRLQRGRLKIQDLLLAMTQTCIVLWAVIAVMALGAFLIGGK